MSLFPLNRKTATHQKCQLPVRKGKGAGNKCNIITYFDVIERLVEDPSVNWMNVKTAPENNLEPTLDNFKLKDKESYVPNLVPSDGKRNAKAHKT